MTESAPMPLLDIATLQPSSQNQIWKSKDQVLLHCSLLDKFSLKNRNLSFAWKVSIPRNVNFDREHLKMRNKLLVKAVSTLETKSTIQSEHEQDGDHNFRLNSDSRPEIHQESKPTSDETSAETGERERLRRMRISKANKGNVPWNKGRKHSAETLQRIRERTKLAMQDPKIRMKLVNLGHAQSLETRQKIGVGVRMGWQKRREKLMVQESCCYEWQNLIAEASRKGYGCEELQWDSYKILDIQLAQEWAKSLEERKLMPKLKGNKRAPKSPEQRRKISMAISAKWTDPEYRGRVCSALAKYHGTTDGVKNSPPRRRPSGDGQSRKSSVKRKVRDVFDYSMNERKSHPLKLKKRKAPSYKDPLADSKLEMIRNIRAHRMDMETKKIEAMERAKLLISEAKKAAKALEAAAMTSPLAYASLMETRKLIAEATRSIEAVETGQRTSYKDDSNSLELNGVVNPYDKSDGGDGDLAPTYIKEMNGTNVPLPINEDRRVFDFSNFTVQNLLSHGQNMETELESHDSSTLNREPDTLINGTDETEQQVDPVKTNGAISNGRTPMPSEVTRLPQTEIAQTSSTTNSTKKWVCGRLVEVSETD